MPTPKRCNVAVPTEKPNANNNGFTAHGISIPWAKPWNDPKNATNIIIMLVGSFFSIATDNPRNITEKVKSKYPDIESTIVLEAAANSLEGKPVEVSLTEEQSVIVNALVKEPTIYNISEVMALEVEAGGLNVSDPVDLLKTFTPVQDWMRDIKGMPKTVNKMFSYDYRTKTYKCISRIMETIR